MREKAKGSLTVEAIISFSVFLMVMFLLLTLVKMVLFMVILNNAATETAKTISVAFYPLTIINDTQDHVEDLEDTLKPEKLGETLKTNAGAAVMSKVFGGSPGQVLKTGGTAFVKNLIGGVAVKGLKDYFYDLKGKAVKWICGKLVSAYVTDTGLFFDQDKMVLRIAKVPETDGEFKTVHKEALLLSDSGELKASPSSSATGMDGDFNAEDVLICLEYPYDITIPFLPAFSITLRSTAVEHAWLNGTVGGPSRKEGIDISNLVFGKNQQVVLPTGGYGKCYHKPNCPTLWTSQHKSTIQAAEAMGYKPCKVCKPNVKDK